MATKASFRGLLLTDFVVKSFFYLFSSSLAVSTCPPPSQIVRIIHAIMWLFLFLLPFPPSIFLLLLH